MKAAKNIFLLFIISLLTLSCSSRDDDWNVNDNPLISPIGNYQLKISTPEPGETWKPGTTQVITWSFPESIDKVQIILYRKDELKMFLTVNTENTGKFEWKIPAQFLNSVHYRIKIVAYDLPLINKTSDYFFILDR